MFLWYGNNSKPYLIFFPFNLLLRRSTSIPDGSGTGRTPGFVVCLSNVCLIDGVKVGGTTELVLSASVDKDDVPASPFSSSEILIAGSSSLAVEFFGLLPFEVDVPTLCGEMANVWEGE